MTKLLEKQLTINRLIAIANSCTSYKLLADLSDQKIAIVGIGKKRLISTIATMTTTLEDNHVEVPPTVPFRDVLEFITDYNKHFTNLSKSELESYKLYLQVKLKSSNRYEFVKTDALLLKIQSEMATLHKRLNPKSILCFPISPDVLTNKNLIDLQSFDHAFVD